MEKYTETHEWINTDDGKFGISSYAIAQLGDVVFIDLPEIGKKVKAGEEIAVVESVKAASEIYAPVSGEIIAVNEELKNNPASLIPTNWKSAYIAVIKPENEAEFSKLKTQKEYTAMIGE